MPEELCRVRVDSNLVEPFLPPGKELKQEMKDFGVNSASEGCTVYVDGQVVLSSTGEWRAKGITTQEAANVGDYDMFQGGNVAAWESGAATMVSCHAPNELVVTEDGGGKGKAEQFFIEVHVPEPEDSTETAMKKFIGPYAKAYRKTLPCQDG